MKKFNVFFRTQNEDTSWTEWQDIADTPFLADDEEEAVSIAKDWIADNWILDEGYEDRFDIIAEYDFKTEEIEETPEEKEINVLIADRCTEKEAKAALKRGTQVYSIPQEWIDSLKESNCYDGQTIEEARKGKYTDVSTVIYNDHEYLIEYIN